MSTNTVTLQSGVKITTFPSPLPDAIINPATAGAEMLVRHGLPPRPGPGEHRLHYDALLGGKSTYIVPTFTEHPDRHHRPSSSVVVSGTPNVVDTSWAGGVVYATGNSTFDQVSAQWNVPNPIPEAADNNLYYCSSWVGIDGSGSGDVFQAGVECDVRASAGTTTQNIYPWFEWFPSYEVAINNFPVAAGDQVACLLNVLSLTSGSCTFRNVGRSSITTFDFTAPAGTTLIGNCAEWIVERPGIQNALSNLAGYGVVNFLNAQARLSDSTIVQAGTGTTFSMQDNAGVVTSVGQIIAPQQVRCVYTGRQIGPWQTRIYESGSTFGSESNGVWQMVKYGNTVPLNLAYIKTSNTPNNRVEVHIASGVSNYQQRVLETATTFGVEDNGTWLLADWNGDGFPDLIYIKTRNTGTGKVEVHVASHASNYQTRIFESGTTFEPEDNGVWSMVDWERTGNLDLVYIKTRNTGTGRVEIHVASAASGYQKRVLETGTTFAPEDDGTWLMAMYANGPHPDLAFIKTSNTESLKVEVHIASAGSNYQERVIETGTTFFPESNGMWSMDKFRPGDGLDLIYVKTTSTGTGQVEVHVAQNLN